MYFACNICISRAASRRVQAPRRIYIHARIITRARAHAPAREKLPSGTDEFEPSFCHQFAANASAGAIKILRPDMRGATRRAAEHRRRRRRGAELNSTSLVFTRKTLEGKDPFRSSRDER